MRMLAVLGVGLVLGAAGWADRTRHVGLGDVAHCLRSSGAKVDSASMLRQAAPWKQLLGRRGSTLYEIELGGKDRGTLLRVGRDVSGEQLQRVLDAEGASMAAQSSGRILVLWYGRPAAGSAAALNRCLD
jgi:hypothetical protein